MKKATTRNTRFAPVGHLDAVVGGARAVIIDTGSPTPPGDSDPNVRTQIIDIG
jgi:hypothetical protein